MNLITATLTRTSSLENQTMGKLNVYEGWNIIAIAKTLEPPWKNNKRMVSCIPVGKYWVIKRWSPRFKKHFHILDVPNRTWILIHAGNFYWNSTGCVLVGEDFGHLNKDGIPDLVNSKAMLKKLLEVLPDRFLLEVKNEF